MTEFNKNDNRINRKTGGNRPRRQYVPAEATAEIKAIEDMTKNSVTEYVNGYDELWPYAGQFEVEGYTVWMLNRYLRIDRDTRAFNGAMLDLFVTKEGVDSKYVTVRYNANETVTPFMFTATVIDPAKGPQFRSAYRNKTTL